MSVFAGLNDRPNPLVDLSGAIGGSGINSLLPIWPTRKYFIFSNNSTHDMSLVFGGATATCALTSGRVSSVAVVNAGRAYSYAPLVRFVGGSYVNNYKTPNTEGVGGGGPAYAAPNGDQNQASAVCTMSGSAAALTVASIAVQNGGANYIAAPQVVLENDPRDPVGTAIPSATYGILIKAGSAPFIMKAEFCSNAQVAVFGTAADTFTCYAAP